MDYINFISYFFGGFFLANAIPHLVNGISGRAFQTPFAKPPGKGLSSSLVNVLWSWVNLVIAYFLIFQVGVFDIHILVQVLAVGLGILVCATALALHFGQFHGGNAP
jgi:hypothetical protein